MELIKQGKFGLKLEAESKIDVDYIAQKGILICSTNSAFISDLEFKEIFKEIGEMAKHHNVKKLIFDKRSLKVFDQNSMEWYHIVWKKEMKKYGLKSYRKILPEDSMFVKSVEIGRAKILAKYPDFSFEDYDIQYCNSIEEAVEK
jgi:hypothetical protein